MRRRAHFGDGGEQPSLLTAITAQKHLVKVVVCSPPVLRCYDVRLAVHDTSSDVHERAVVSV